MLLPVCVLVTSILASRASPVFGACSGSVCESCNSGEGQFNGLCKCDSSCGLFGDCCDSSIDLNTCTSDKAVPSGVDFACRSIYPDSRIVPQVNESFWMVSSCPSSWSNGDTSREVVKDSCISLNSSLPPITDLNSGTVYANEFCALCNGVQNLLAWQPNLACTSNVYEQIEEIGLQELLKSDPTIFQTECQTCSFRVPNIQSILQPRPCFHSISTCIDLFTLEELTRQEFTQNDYNTLSNRCENGTYNLVMTKSDTLYRNEDCALCNGMNEEFACFAPTVRNGIPQECAPVIDSPTTPSFTTVQPAATKPVPTTNGPSDQLPFPFTLFPNVGINNRIFPFTQSPLVPPEAPISGIQPPLLVPEALVPGSSVVVVPPEVPISGGIPFTIALSNLGGGQVQVTVLTENITVTVDCPDGQAALGLECRPTLCPEGYVANGGRCASFPDPTPTNNTTTLCYDGFVSLNMSDYTLIDNNTLLHNEQLLTIVRFDLSGKPVICLNNSFIGEFLDCPTGFIALNHSEFTDLGNDTILFEGEKFSVIDYDNQNRPVICPPNGTTVTHSIAIYSYPPGFLILTYVGCSLSMIGSALVLLTYGIFKTLRTLPSLILMNLCFAILANNLFVIIGGPVTQAFPTIELCTAVAICLHFFFLAQFSWMTIMSFQMARTFYQARKMKLDSKHQRKVVFGLYFLIGWSIPLAITTTSVVVNFTTEDLVLYGVLEDGQLGSCWINHLESAIASFIVPLILSLILNTILFFVVTTLICVAARSSSKINKKNNFHFFRVNAAVFSVTGLTWVFGFIAILARTNWAWYPFIIFNSAQGFVIFVAFLLTKRVMILYRNLILCRSSTDTTKSHKSNDSTSDTQQQNLDRTTTQVVMNV